MSGIQQLLSLFRISVSWQALSLTFLFIVGFSWWVYSKAQAEIQLKHQSIRNAFENLYSPTLGILEATKNGKITIAKRDEQLLNLFVERRAVACHEEIRDAIDDWLRGQGTIDDLIIYLRNVCKESWKTLYQGDILVDAGDTVKWLLRISIVIVLVMDYVFLICAVTFLVIYHFRSVGLWFWIALAGIAGGATLAALFIRLKYKKHQHRSDKKRLRLESRNL